MGTHEAVETRPSPLDEAAAQGPMHWTDDPVLDPPGTPEPLHVDRHEEVVVTPLGSAGGH